MNILKIKIVSIHVIWFTLDNGEVLCMCGSEVGDVSLWYIDCG